MSDSVINLNMESEVVTKTHRKYFDASKTMNGKQLRLTKKQFYTYLIKKGLEFFDVIELEKMLTAEKD